MSGDLLSLKIAIVSDVGAERELLRKAAAQSAIPITVSDVDIGGVGISALTGALAADGHDAVFFDSRIPKPERLAVLDAIRAAPNRPLAVLIGAAAIKTREVLTDGLDIDCAVAKPIDLLEAQELMERCARARLPRRVMIVDDSSTVRSVVRKVLLASRFRIETEEAADGAAAVALAGNQSFDVVFLDCQMPGMDGFEALTAIQRLHPDIMVVMITGTRDARTEQRARAQGAKELLYKPFFAKDIDAVLRRLLGLSPAQWN